MNKINFLIKLISQGKRWIVTAEIANNYIVCWMVNHIIEESEARKEIVPEWMLRVRQGMGQRPH